MADIDGYRAGAQAMSEERCQQCNGVGEIMETAYGDVKCPRCSGVGIEPTSRLLQFDGLADYDLEVARGERDG